VLVRQLSLEYSIGTIYLAQCVWILVPIAFLAVPELHELNLNEIGILLLAAIAAGYGQLAMNEGYRCLTVTTGATIQMLWPVSTTLGGWLLFNEVFGPLQWIGAVLILASIWQISIAGLRARKVAA
jgi:drug/metabolite transporter (DMT)-like permease